MAHPNVNIANTANNPSHPNNAWDWIQLQRGAGEHINVPFLKAAAGTLLQEPV